MKDKWLEFFEQYKRMGFTDEHASVQAYAELANWTAFQIDRAVDEGKDKQLEEKS